MNNMNSTQNENNNGQQYNGQQYGGPQYNGQQYNGQQYGSPQYNGQQYNGPQYNGQYPHGPQLPDGKGFSIAALILGICSAFFSLFLAAAYPANLIILVCGIVGIILGVTGRKKSIACYGRASGVATAGFILSIIGTALSALFVLSCMACLACIGSEIGELGDIMMDSMF